MPGVEVPLQDVAPAHPGRLEAIRRASARVKQALRERYPPARGYTHRMVDDAAKVGIAFRNMYTVFRGLAWGLQLNLQSKDLEKLYFGVGAFTRLTRAVMYACLGTGGAAGFLAPIVLSSQHPSKLAVMVCALIGLAAGAVLCLAVLGVLYPFTARRGVSRQDTEKLFAELRPLVDAELSGQGGTGGD